MDAVTTTPPTRITPQTNPELFVKEQDSATGLSGDFSFFLRLLTTQLQNQDPTEPLDVSQMTQQIAQYSGVEQQVKTNTILEKLIASNATVTQGTQLATAAGYIGSEVESRGNTGEVLGGQGAFTYVLPKQAEKVEITIKNAQGRTVFEGAGTTKSGRNIIVWDGVNSGSGQREPDGAYTITVKATDNQNKPIVAETRSVGIVAGFEKDGAGNILLGIGDRAVNLNDVIAVRPPTRIVQNTPNSADAA